MLQLLTQLAMLTATAITFQLHQKPITIGSAARLLPTHHASFQAIVHVSGFDVEGEEDQGGFVELGFAVGDFTLDGDGALVDL